MFADCFRKNKKTRRFSERFVSCRVTGPPTVPATNTLRYMRAYDPDAKAYGNPVSNAPTFLGENNFELV